MGHYDSCYEGDREARWKKHQQDIDLEFSKLQTNLETHQKIFLLDIAKDIDNWISFVGVIHSISLKNKIK